MGPQFFKRHEVKLLAACMALLAVAAGWVLSTRPGHKIEGDFLEREQAGVVDAWLLEQATTHPIAEFRARACLALGRIGDPAGREALLTSLRAPAPSVRAAAAFALGLMEDAAYRPGREADEAAASALLAALGDEERRVVAYSVEALGRLRWGRAAESLTATPAPLVFTLTALARMDAREWIPWMARALKSNDQDVRWAAAFTLNEMEAACDEDMRRSFANLTRDRSAFVRAAAAAGLGRCTPDEQALTALARAAADPDPKVRIEAAWAAARLGDPRAAPLVEALAGDSHPSVVEQAAGLRRYVDPAERAEWERRARAAGRTLALRPTLPDVPAPPAAAAPLAAPLDPAELQRIARLEGRSLVIETSEGAFPVALDYDNAPLAAERFYRMAVEGRFDGQTFSVRAGRYARAAAREGTPASVAQPNPAPFLRGSLGMVRASRRGDAPEFFIALSPLPLADGAYTNFGRLTAGDDTLDRVRTGTRLLRIREAAASDKR